MSDNNEKLNWVKETLGFLSQGDTNRFFERLDENVRWKQETFHPVTRTSPEFHSNKELRAIFDGFQKLLKSPLKFRIKNILKVENENIYIAQVEEDVIPILNIPSENHQCWILYVEENPRRIVFVNSYIDSWSKTHFYEQLEEKKKHLTK